MGKKQVKVEAPKEVKKEVVRWITNLQTCHQEVIDRSQIGAMCNYGTDNDGEIDFDLVVKSYSKHWIAGRILDVETDTGLVLVDTGDTGEAPSPNLDPSVAKGVAQAEQVLAEIYKGQSPIGMTVEVNGEEVEVVHGVVQDEAPSEFDSEASVEPFPEPFPVVGVAPCPPSELLGRKQDEFRELTRELVDLIDKKDGIVLASKESAKHYRKKIEDVDAQISEAKKRVEACETIEFEQNGSLVCKSLLNDSIVWIRPIDRQLPLPGIVEAKDAEPTLFDEPSEVSEPSELAEANCDDEPEIMGPSFAADEVES